MTNDPTVADTYLSRDKWVAARARELGLDPCMAETGHPSWAGFRGDVSRFLWRLKPDGAAALARGESLASAHFL